MEGKQTLINSLKEMTANPQIAGREGNAVMEVVCAASIANKAVADEAEASLQELKRLRKWKSDTESAHPVVAPAPQAISNNFSQKANRVQASPSSQGSMAPPSRVAPRAAMSRQIPQESSSTMQNAQPAMFQWLRAGGTGQGMEKINYASVADKDFSMRSNATAYNRA